MMGNAPLTGEPMGDGPSGAGLRAPTQFRRRVDRLSYKREDQQARLARVGAELSRLDDYLAISEQVTAALETLNQTLFRELLELVEQKLTIALQEVLDQPITFHADVDFKRGAAAVDF